MRHVICVVSNNFHAILDKRGTLGVFQPEMRLSRDLVAGAGISQDENAHCKCFADLQLM